MKICLRYPSSKSLPSLRAARCKSPPDYLLIARDPRGKDLLSLRSKFSNLTCSICRLFLLVLMVRLPPKSSSSGDYSVPSFRFFKLVVI